MRRALPLLLAALFAVPASASAAREVSYKVTVEGEGVYSYDYVNPDSHRKSDAHFKWRTDIPIVAFDGDSVYTQSAENASATTTATLVSPAEGLLEARGGTDYCSTSAIKTVEGGHFLAGDDLPTPAPGIWLGLRVLGQLVPNFDSCPGQSGAGFWISPNLVDGEQTFDNWFTIPHEAIGMGRIIQLLHKDVTGKLCPNNRTGTGNCHLTYDVTVTFDKFYDTGPDSSGSSGTPGGGGGGTPSAKGVVVKPASAKLPASAARATLEVTCPAKCDGTVTATLPRGRKASAAKALARSRFTVAAGKTQRVVVRFSRAAQKKIRRAGGVSLKVRTVSAGKTDERVLSLRLKGRAR